MRSTCKNAHLKKDSITALVCKIFMKPKSAGVRLLILDGYVISRAYKDRS